MVKRRVVPKRSGKEGGARAAEGPVFAAHPSAVIDPGAVIGAGTRIWH